MPYHLLIFVCKRGPWDVCAKIDRARDWTYPASKFHGANMGSIWGRQDPDGPRVGPMNFAIWVLQPKDLEWGLLTQYHPLILLNYIQNFRDFVHLVSTTFILGRCCHRLTAVTLGIICIGLNGPNRCVRDGRNSSNGNLKLLVVV